MFGNVLVIIFFLAKIAKFHKLLSYCSC